MLPLAVGGGIRESSWRAASLESKLKRGASIQPRKRKHKKIKNLASVKEGFDKRTSEKVAGALGGRIGKALKEVGIVIEEGGNKLIGKEFREEAVKLKLGE